MSTLREPGEAMCPSSSPFLSVSRYSFVLMTVNFEAPPPFVEL